MDRNAAALSILCAILTGRTDAETLEPKTGEQRIRTAFHMADVFLAVSQEPAVPPARPLPPEGA